MEKKHQKPKIIEVFLNLVLIITGLMWLAFSTAITSDSMGCKMFDTAFPSLVVAAGIFDIFWYLKKYVDYRFHEL
ncbi:MAG: hypothetical protein K9M75_03330 [Phycisphaerae bacterium]|nr:hypothetical protein [Phycisphaerae bacterium]